MHITFLVPSIKTGGGYRVIVELANELSLNNEVNIIFPNSEDSNSFSLSKNVRLIPIGKSNGGQIGRIINTLNMILYTRKVKSIYISTGPTVSPFLFLVRNIFNFLQADDYSIFDDKSLIKSKSLLSFYKIVTKIAYKYRNVDFIFNSNFTYQQYLKVSKRNDIETRIVNPAINHSVFYPIKNKVGNKKIRIGIVGRKHPLKGLQTFIEAYNLFLKRRDIEVIFISHEDFSMWALPKEWVQKSPITDTEIGDLYRKCDIFISTSWQEGFGLPALEAMACGAAVITSNSGGSLEYAKNNENCLIYSPGNTKELVNCIIKLLDDDVLREKISRKGIKYAGKFTWENSAKKLSKILNSK